MQSKWKKQTCLMKNKAVEAIFVSFRFFFQLFSKFQIIISLERWQLSFYIFKIKFKHHCNRTVELFGRVSMRGQFFFQFWSSNVLEFQRSETFFIKKLKFSLKMSYFLFSRNAAHLSQNFDVLFVGDMFYDDVIGERVTQLVRCFVEGSNPEEKIVLVGDPGIDKTIQLWSFCSKNSGIRIIF